MLVTVSYCDGSQLCVPCTFTCLKSKLTSVLAGYVLIELLVTNLQLVLAYNYTLVL